jgi:hypothetical protein
MGRSGSLSFELRVDPLQKAPKFGNIPFWNQLNPPLVFYHHHFLSRSDMQCLSDCFGYYNLVFWRYGYRMHIKSSIDNILYYNNTINSAYQNLFPAPLLQIPQ